MGSVDRRATADSAALQPALHEDRGIDAVRQAPQFIRGLPDVGAELGQDFPDLVIVAFGQLASQARA